MKVVEFSQPVTGLAALIWAHGGQMGLAEAVGVRPRAIRRVLTTEPPQKAETRLRLATYAGCAPQVLEQRARTWRIKPTLEPMEDEQWSS